MSGLLQRLVGQAHGAENGARVRSAMSVHAQVPLTAPVAEARALPGPEGLDAQAPPAGPHNIYMSGSTTLDPEPSSSQSALPHDMDSQVDSPPRSAPSQIRVEKVISKAVVPGPTARLPFLLPLVAEVPVPAVSPVISAALIDPRRGQDSRIRPETRREPTEVHVRIGRIDVIAAPEAPAAKKPAPRAARATVPLSEYLAKRART